MTVFGLDEAYHDLKRDCDHFKIEIPAGKNIIMHKGTVIPINPMSTARECKKLLRVMIKDAKKEEFQRKQGKLL